VFAVPSVVAAGRAIDDRLLITECSHSGEWDGRVQFPAAVGNSVLLLRAEATADEGPGGLFVREFHTPR
jgi:hypothetical protein